MSDEEGVLTTPLPDYFSRFDATYAVEVYQMEDAALGDIVLVDTLTIARPYVDPATLVEDPYEIEEATAYEAVARALIDSITGGFKYERDVFEAQGQGADFIPSPSRLNKIIRVYENNILVYDAEPTDPEWSNIKHFQITPDRTAITVAVQAGYKRHQSRPVRVHNPASDSFQPYDGSDEGSRQEPLMDRNYSFFPLDWDYVIVVDAGWPVIPNDIQQAAKMLYNDLKCNNMPYMNSYVKEYESGQFIIKFADGAFTQTGNRIVDNILSNYARMPLNGLGVL